MFRPPGLPLPRRHAGALSQARRAVDEEALVARLVDAPTRPRAASLPRRRPAQYLAREAAAEREAEAARAAAAARAAVGMRDAALPA